LASSNKFTATASILTEFLPILDAVEALREKYMDDPFGKQYNAVAGAVKSALTELGVTSYEVKVGDLVDTIRIDPMESVYSTDYPKGTIIQVISNGLELNGNIVRPAKCVVSLGVEPQQQEEQQPDENENSENEIGDDVVVSEPVEESATKTTES
jgi:molecular chaperone GrpE (heat shock protein)